MRKTSQPLTHMTAPQGPMAIRTNNSTQIPTKKAQLDDVLKFLHLSIVCILKRLTNPNYKQADPYHLTLWCCLPCIPLWTKLLHYPWCEDKISLLKTVDSGRLLKSALWDYEQGKESFILIFLLKYPKRSRDPPSLIFLQWQLSHENCSLDWVIHLSKTSLHHLF